MSRISTEQWERRKWYLIRSLFDEDPKLSPIPERQELLLEPVSAPEVTINRPLSPLPNLIIEKEPNRHDEPEEFYEELEREVMELYRSLFIDSESFSQCSEQRQSSDNTNNSVAQLIDRSYNSKNHEELMNCSSEKSGYQEEQSREEITSEIQNKTKLRITSEHRSTTSELRDYEMIVTQALVHQAAEEESDKDIRHMSKMDKISSEIQNPDSSSLSTNIKDFNEQSEDEQMQTDSDDFSNSEQQRVFDLSIDKGPKLAIDYVTDGSSSPEEPEIMRRKESSKDSVQSFDALGFERHFLADFSGEKRFETTPVRALEEVEVPSYGSSVVLGTTSTPIIARKVGSGNRKRRIPTESRQFLSKKKVENIAMQTSFSSSDPEDNWKEIMQHFLNGNPRIFKLCSCSNHNCC